jgi:probable addiction module antidote protein
LDTKPFDPADFIDTPETQLELLRDAFASGEARYVAVALGTVARARGMTEIAREAGVTREALYRALSEDGDPRLSTFMGVIGALGLELSVRGAA